MASLPAGAEIASAALRYAGLGYVYGGTASRPGDWDCSSFVSYVLGHDLGLQLPGGGTFGDPGYPPASHGPVVLSYAGWKGATTLGANEPASAGDMCIWAGAGPLGHIGIATGATHMISALDTTDGTVHTPIAGYGPAGARFMVRRINGVGQQPAGGGGGGGAGSVLGGAGAILAGALAGGAVTIGLLGAALLGALLLGSAAAAALVFAMRNAANGS